MTTFTEKKILPGSVLYATPLNAILFGCPIEVLKYLLMQKQALPSILVIPDKLSHQSTCQASVEFLIYHFLFIQKGLARDIKLKIYTTSESINSLRDLIRVTLLGITKQEAKNLDKLLNLKEAIDQEELNHIIKENEYFALKKSDGSILQIDDFIEFSPLNIGDTVEIIENGDQQNSIKIDHLKENCYNITYQNKTYSCDINFNESQKPCYPIKQEPLLKEEMDDSNNIFSIRVLGASEGFDPHAPANGYLIRAKGKWMLWDCPGYTSNHLKLIGLTIDDMDAIFISHVHEDHLDIAQIISKNKQLNIYSTPEVFHCILIKAMAVTGCSYEQAKNLFKYYPIYHKKPFDLYGVGVEVFHSVHSIPAIGCKISVPKYNLNQGSTFFISGDHASNNKIAEINLNIKISADRLQFITKNFLPDPLSDVTFIDAGKGIVHGDENEYKDAKITGNKRMYFMHTRNVISLENGQKLLKQGDHIIIHR